MTSPRQHVGWAGAFALLAGAVLGCTGDIGDDQDEDPPEGPEAICAADAALTVPLQRINADQFRQVVTELFGEGIVFDTGFPVPVKGYAYSTYSAANPVADAQVKPILETVEAIAMQVADRIPACPGDETTCATTYLADVATRALRRAPTDGEMAILMARYTGAKAEMDHAESTAVAVATLLQMPQFLYLLEAVPEPDGTPTTLDGQEIAQRMALLYWNGLPDEDLLAAAADGSLADPEVRRAQARRMLEDPRAKSVIGGFLREWMMIKGFAADVHEPELQAALEEELTRDIDAALASSTGLRDLLTSNKTFVNSVLETFYGLPAVSTGPDDWREVELDPEMRVGVLTHPLLLAKFAHGEAPSDILRGKFVRVNLLCVDIEPPPTGAAEQQKEIVAEGASIREQAQARLDHPTCGGCHRLMDPIGFGFSAFDGAGRYEPVVGGVAVDTSGAIQPPSDISGEFHGVRELGEKLAAGTEVGACFSKQWVRYTLGKRELQKEECSMDEIGLALGEQSQTLLDTFAGVAALTAFVQRAAEETEQ
ncbi:MAG: DUF1592 domain-containing protein [Myxococcales bacterium]|nr:DUF1592 domain-containing protein [Myxococcales bacterium]